MLEQLLSQQGKTLAFVSGSLWGNSNNSQSKPSKPDRGVGYTQPWSSNSPDQPKTPQRQAESQQAKSPAEELPHGKPSPENLISEERLEQILSGSDVKPYSMGEAGEIPREYYSGSGLGKITAAYNLPYLNNGEAMYQNLGEEISATRPHFVINQTAKGREIIAVFFKYKDLKGNQVLLKVDQGTLYNILFGKQLTPKQQEYLEILEIKPETIRESLGLMRANWGLR